MGMTGKMITNYVGNGTLKKYGVRFTSQVNRDTLESEAKIVDIREENGENLVDLEIVTTNQDGSCCYYRISNCED